MRRKGKIEGVKEGGKDEEGEGWGMQKEKRERG